MLLLLMKMGILLFMCLVFKRGDDYFYSSYLFIFFIC